MTTPQSFTLSTTLVRSDDLLFSQMDNEIVMMSLEKEQYYGLDAIGSHIWTLLQQPLTVAQLCDRLVHEYGVDPEVCQTDTLAFLDELYAEEIITIVATTGSVG